MQRGRRVPVLLGLVVASLATATGGTGDADAATISAFRIGYRTQVNGGVIFAQNSSLTCSSTRAERRGEDPAGCETAKNGQGSLQNNNSWVMTHVDVDDDPTTYNSSAGDLNIPSGGRVVYAALYWGAYRKGADGRPGAPADIGTIRLSVPGADGYVTLTADPADIIAPPASVDGDLPYQAKVVVTDLVQAAGAGTYTVADLPAALGGNRYAGWTLATVFEDPSRPLRDITLFDGLSVVRRSDRSDVITISGFRAPVEGAVDGTVGIVAYDGDRSTSGDYARFDGVALTSPESPATNFFNSTIDTFGSLVTSRNPAPVNNFGFDVKVADATGIVANGATQAQIELGTVGETIYVGLVSTRIDLTAPRFPPVKSVVNLTGHDPAQPGDVLRYRMTVTNKGDDPADAVVVTDAVPTGTTYVEGTLTLDGASLSDAVGDDQGEVVDGQVTVRVGEGATATAGGRVGIEASTTVTFDVTVDEAAAGTTIDNTGSVAYRAVTLERDLVTPTNTVLVPVAADDPVAAPEPGRAVLEVSKAAPERVPAGEVLHYDMTVRNVGTATATDVVLTDVVPAGVAVELVHDGCAEAGGVVTCAVGDLAPGEVWFGQLEVRVDDGIAPETRIDNVAAVSASDADTVEASVRTRVSGDDDLGVDVSVVPPSVDGDDGVQVAVEVTNQGDDTSDEVTTLVVLPPGWTADEGDHGCQSDPEVPEVLSCAVGDLGAGEGDTVVLTVRPGDGSNGAPDAGVLVKANSTELDRDPADNIASTPLVAGNESSPTLPSTGGSATVAWWAVLALATGGVIMVQRRLRTTTSRAQW